MQNLKPLASLYGWAGLIESYLIANTEDRFYRDEAQISFVETSYEIISMAILSLSLIQVQGSY